MISSVKITEKTREGIRYQVEHHLMDLGLNVVEDKKAAEGYFFE